MKEIAPEVVIVPLKIANAYLVGTSALWFLVDSGMPGEEKALRKAVQARFGKQAKPAGIVLTHGHQDHSGSARVLAEEWQIPIYAHSLEMPYLSGKSKYPPIDPTAPGVLSVMGRFLKQKPIDLGPGLTTLDEANPLPGLSGWQAIFTPGHSPGHVSFFRGSDGVLLGGDAFTTANFESLVGLFLKKQQLTRPLPASTINWPQARESVARLARLHPALLAAGHGNPMPNLNQAFQKFADSFAIPSHGRYINTSVETGTVGTLALPPAPFDPLPGVAKSVLVASIALGLGAAYPQIRKVLRKKS